MEPGDLLAAGRPPDATVAFARDRSFTNTELRARAAAVAEATGARRGERWLLSCRSSFDFAAALIALAEAGAAAVLPPNLAPGSVEQLARGCAGGLVDADATVDLDGPRIDPASVGDATPRDPRPLERDAPLVELCTSGSTGGAKRVLKLVRHLADEVAVLERCFGARLAADTRVFATVSHQHIYGLLWRVLWPLATGRPFCAESYLHAEELLPRVAEVPRALVASTPAHLKRLAPRAGLRELRGRVVELLSSGGPLATDTALAVEEALGCAPLEIFGSTETGGVASRRRSRAEPDPAWRALPGVELARTAEGRLLVRSPFASVGEDGGDGRTAFEMGDRAELDPDAPGSFRLGARADRIVKIAEKRLSLPEMEERLAEHPWVEEVALVVLGASGDARVHAAVALTAPGRAELERGGRRAVGTALAEHLARHVDRVGLPRAWRYVDELPRNPQGKLVEAELAALFATEPERPRLPRLLERRVEGACVEERFEVPADLAQLEGHFEGLPVVPGVVQLDWVMRAAREQLVVTAPATGMEALKFSQALVPGQRATLRVELGERGDRLRFTVADGETVFTSGRFLLAAPEDDA